MVTGAMNEHGQKYLSKCGEVTKSRGMGIFSVKLDEGGMANFRSINLRGL